MDLSEAYSCEPSVIIGASQRSAGCVRPPALDKKKRIFDIILAIIVIFVVSPLLFVIAILVRLDGGSILFRHTRLGANGVPFQCLKFRTMRVDAEAALQATLKEDPNAARQWTEHRKLLRDPRVTFLGRLLRSASLDELPQLVNVLRGEMSMVGPRPIVDEEVFRFGKNISYYYQARPGLTGLWQVSGRSNMLYSARVALDVIYVSNYTLWNDLKILRKTFAAVLLQRGAR